jgi:hypothetical protein
VPCLSVCLSAGNLEGGGVQQTRFYLQRPATASRGTVVVDWRLLRPECLARGARLSASSGEKTLNPRAPPSGSCARGSPITFGALGLRLFRVPWLSFRRSARVEGSGFFRVPRLGIWGSGLLHAWTEG